MMIKDPKNRLKKVLNTLYKKPENEWWINHKWLCYSSL